jgi:hypothetical protein
VVHVYAVKETRKKESEREGKKVYETRQDKGVTGVFDSKAYHGVGIL